ncbi:lysophospholipid acyltransferase family protein [Phytoactinopolyspora halotolerans]|uniref:1-acyl-sn-glycerol-3-phosphate acyltransferase n=1 Tax=Phytoactinopolyspora halotolerans TaxID=1981512 RepID=A0A6L9SG54_9ACTN|nr:lysophospholipid acyltransferase family protein [Phytoactinopolyspora halotolerans]NEE04113.1 1-acyl-sn-glycerol-3-phosphate acyltransferase [Phytoactinopolyspora halotolerans]
MELVGAIAVGLTRLFGKVEADGLENLPMTGPAIIAVNHTTIADVPPVLSTLYEAGLRPSVPCRERGCGSDHGHVRFMAASQVFNHSLIGPLARHAGMVEVGLRQAGTVALRAAREALGRGEIVGIYPEGDVSANADGSPRRFRFGVGRLALDTQAPVIPIAHHDARQIGTGSVARSLGGALTSIVRRPTVRLRVGRPIAADEFAGMAIRDAVDLIQTRVTDVWRSLVQVEALGKGRR